MGSGVDKHDLAGSSCDVLLEEQHADSAIVKTPEGFDLLPGNTDLTAAEIELMDEEGREQRLKRALDPLRGRYDFIIVDCPPALSLLTLNALTAADSVLVPMQCEYYALEGLSDLVGTLRKVKQNLNPRIEIEALVRTMYDPRSALTIQVSDEIKRHYGDKVFDTVIPRNVRIAEAPSFGKPVLLHDPASKGAAAHLQFARELLERNGIKVMEAA